MFGRATDGYAAVPRKWFGMDVPDAPPFLEMDACFLNVIHNECPGSDEVWRVAERVLGPRWAAGESIRCTHASPRPCVGFGRLEIFPGLPEILATPKSSWAPNRACRSAHLHLRRRPRGLHILAQR